MLKTQTSQSWLHTNTIRLARVHFVYILLYCVQTVMFDSWKLVPPNVVLYRWLLAAGLAVITTFIWYLAHNTIRSTNAYKGLIWLLILADITAASLNVYSQRGMASRAVVEYALPIIVSAVLMSRVALFATATLCAAAYTSTALAYFVLNFNEGYKIELYSEVGFYAVVFFVFAALLWIVVRAKKTTKH